MVLYAYFAGAALAVATTRGHHAPHRTRQVRSQPVTSLDLVAADDALRLASVTAAAAGLVVALAAFAGQVEAIARSMQTDWLRWPLNILALGAVFLALVSFFSAFRPEAWRLGRRHAPSSAA